MPRKPLDQEPDEPQDESESWITDGLQLLASDEAQDAVFKRLQALALNGAIEIMELKLEPTHSAFNQLLTRKAAIISAVLAATGRVTPGRLRGKENDKMDEVIAAMKEQKERLDLLS